MVSTINATRVITTESKEVYWLSRCVTAWSMTFQDEKSACPVLQQLIKDGYIRTTNHNAPQLGWNWFYTTDGGRKLLDEFLLFIKL